MNILVIGGGGREHAVAWALAKNPGVRKLWCAPGNGGTAAFAENVPLSATDLEGALAFCRENRPDYVAVLSDDPLALGMVDLLEENGFAAFGPTKAAARVEWSKAWSKAFMTRHGIPTARAVTVTACEAAAYAKGCDLPVAIKADGLALGKGVVLCHTREEAEAAVAALAAAVPGQSLLFEEFLTGPEVTQLAFCDGAHISLLPVAQDHKRAFDGDIGPNTGGMGVCSPVPCYTGEVHAQAMEQIYLPTVRGLVAEGICFRGILYFGLMLTDKGPMVIEYNARFGDPEAQCLLPLLESDLLEIFIAIRAGRLNALPIHWRQQASCAVVLASGGYPGPYRKGLPIQGLDAVTDAAVFHAGTARKGEALVTSGGRVLCVTATADTLEQAIPKAYSEIGKISFDGSFYRKDIGRRLLSDGKEEN